MSPAPPPPPQTLSVGRQRRSSRSTSPGGSKTPRSRIDWSPLADETLRRRYGPSADAQQGASRPDLGVRAAARAWTATRCSRPASRSGTRATSLLPLDAADDLPLARRSSGRALDDPRLAPGDAFAARLAAAEAAAQPGSARGHPADLGVQASEQGVVIADRTQDGRRAAVAYGFGNEPRRSPAHGLADELDLSPRGGSCDPAGGASGGQNIARPPDSAGAVAADQELSDSTTPRPPSLGAARPTGNGGRPISRRLVPTKSRAALPGRSVHAARAVGCAAAAGAGPGEPCARGARPAFDAGRLALLPERRSGRGGRGAAMVSGRPEVSLERNGFERNRRRRRRGSTARGRYRRPGSATVTRQLRSSGSILSAARWR